MTKEQFLKLQPYEYNLLCARSEYLRSASRTGQELAASVYRELLDREPPRITGCGSCEYEMWRALQYYYFAYKEQMEAEPMVAESAPKKKSSKK